MTSQSQHHLHVHQSVFCKSKSPFPSYLFITGTSSGNFPLAYNSLLSLITWLCKTSQRKPLHANSCHPDVILSLSEQLLTLWLTNYFKLLLKLSLFQSVKQTLFQTALALVGNEMRASSLRVKNYTSQVPIPAPGQFRPWEVAMMTPLAGVLPSHERQREIAEELRASLLSFPESHRKVNSRFTFFPLQCGHHLVETSWFDLHWTFSFLHHPY